MMLLKDRIAQINFYSFLVFVFCMSIHDRLLIYSFNIWALTTVLDIIINKRFSNNKFLKNKSFYLLVILYLVSAISLIYTQNINHGLAILETRIMLLIIPILGIWGLNEYYNLSSIYKTIILGFSTTIVLILGISFINAYFNKQFVFIENSPLLFLQKHIGIIRHRTYFGLYAILTLISLVMINRKKKESLSIISTVVLSGLIISFILFSEARSVAIALFIGIGIFICFFIRLKFTYKILIGSSLLLVLFIIIFYFTYRYENIFSFLKSFDLGFFQNEARIHIWQVALEIIKTNWIFGLGIGDAQEYLNQQLTNDILEKVKSSLNTHNQFLESTLESGIIMPILLLSFIFSLVSSRGNNSFASWWLALTLLITFSFESIINRIAGVSFVAMVSIILSINKYTPNKKLSYFSGRIYNGIIKTIISFSVILIVALLAFHPTFNSQNPKTWGSNSKKYFSLNEEIHNIQTKTRGIIYDNSNIYKDLIRKGYFMGGIYSLTANKGDSISASIYCNVSGNFSGQGVQFICNNQFNEFIATSYSLKKKDSWRILELQKIIKKKENLIFYIFILPDSNQTINGQVKLLKPNFQVHKKKNEK